MLEKNLNVLKTKNPELVQKLINHIPQGVEVNETESCDYNLIYKGIPLHNTIDPQQEAKTIFGEEDKSQNSLRLVFGLGLGYLFKRTYISSAGTIILYEPSLDVLKMTLQLVDFSNELADSRVFIMTDVSEIKIPFYKYMFDKANILFLDSYKELYSDIFDQVYYMLNSNYIDQNTNISKSLKLSESFINNLPYIVKASPVHVLENRFKNLPALVVSAGPSLDKAIDVIKEHRDKFVLISIGQAVKALQAAGIFPDMVVMIDMLPLEQQLQCLGELKSKLHLLLEPGTNINLYKENTLSKFVIFSEHDYMSQWYVDKMGYKTNVLGQTVSIAAFSAAKLVGANPIVLIGQDLAYVGDKIYASNTLYESLRFSESSDDKISVYLNDNELNNNQGDQHYIDSIVKKNREHYESAVIVKGQNGEKLYTINSYAGFLTTYAEITELIKLENPELRLINSSTGGAYIEGFEHIPLSDVVKTLTPINENIHDVIYQTYINNKPEPEKITIINDAFKELLTDLAHLKVDAQNLITFANKLLKEVKISRTITNKSIEMFKKLLKLDSEIKNRNANNKLSFIYPLIQKELFEFNKLNDKQEKTDYNRLICSVNAIIKFSEAMIIAADRAKVAFDKLEEFPFKE